MRTGGEMEQGEKTMAKFVLHLLLGAFLGFFLWFYNLFVLKPKRLRAKLLVQGIGGPSCSSFLYGNIPQIKRIQLESRSSAFTNIPKRYGDHSVSISHDWPSILFAHLEQWRNQFGEIFTYSTGSIQFLCITEMEMIQEISKCTSLSLGKPSYLSNDYAPLLGDGILTSSGLIWVHQRKIIAPEFYLAKVNEMLPLMLDSTMSVLESWERKYDREGGGHLEITVDEDLRTLTADIISRACFGSNYSEGKEIFLKIRALQKAMARGNIGVPCYKYLPMKSNREIWKLEKKIEMMILKVVNNRIQNSHERDLLQMILQAAQSLDKDALSSNISPSKFIVDNCKNIYFAGHETTAVSASWCLMLLALHPEWQTRTRLEVLQCCSDGFLNVDSLRGMKTLTMVIQETLRLYPPSTFVVRQALEDITFKGVQIPKGMNIQIPIPMVQRNLGGWGDDALTFNPSRFVGGILGACKTPHAYLAFGAGGRVCVGQHLAMVVLKVIVSLVLMKFEFSLSPSYKHSPAFRLVIEPEFGVCLDFKRL